MKNAKFRGIPWKKDEFCGKIPRKNSAEKPKIPRFGSKFRGPRKTVGPTNFYQVLCLLKITISIPRCT